MGKKSQKHGKSNKSILRKKEIVIPIVAGAIITIIVSGSFYLLTINNEPCIQGSSGNIYKDCLMNFEIIKPNRDWKFHYDFNVNAPKFEYHFPGQSIVEMVLVQRTNNEQVAVMVFNDEVDLDLEDFLNKDFEFATKDGLPIEITYNLPDENDKDITIKTAIYPSHDNKEFAKLFKERIIKKDGFVYVIHSQILSTQNISEKVKSEVNWIFDSFEFTK